MAWANFWQFVVEGATPLPAALIASVVDDLDFLAEPVTAVATNAPLQRAAAGSDRAQHADRFAPDVLAAAAPAGWADAPQLATVDGEAALALFGVVAAGAPAEEHSVVAQLAAAAIAAGELSIADAAVVAMAHAPWPALQVAAAERFGRDLPVLPGPMRTRWLDALARVGDGRCVRPLEAAMAAHGQHLDDHQAWRVRHIVQVIRRGGRK